MIGSMRIAGPIIGRYPPISLPVVKLARLLHGALSTLASKIVGYVNFSRFGDKARQRHPPS